MRTIHHLYIYTNKKSSRNIDAHIADRQVEMMDSIWYVTETIGWLLCISYNIVYIIDYDTYPVYLDYTVEYWPW